METRKIGIMGGTFNPIHLGHMILAQSAYEEHNLDKVWFLPSKNPPHKPSEDVVPGTVRKEMIELAIQNNPHFELSLLEFEREGPTYTVDTLYELKSLYPEAEFYFIIGGDSLFQLETWRLPGDILRLAHILAASRYHLSDETLRRQIQYLNDKYGCDIRPIQIPTIDISSNLLRRYLKEGRSVRYYLPDAVENYIKENKIYG